MMSGTKRDASGCRSLKSMFARYGCPATLLFFFFFFAQDWIQRMGVGGDRTPPPPPTFDLDIRPNKLNSQFIVTTSSSSNSIQNRIKAVTCTHWNHTPGHQTAIATQLSFSHARIVLLTQHNL